MHVQWYMSGGQKATLWAWFPSFHPMVTNVPTQIIRHGAKHPYLLSHLTFPQMGHFWELQEDNINSYALYS